MNSFTVVSVKKLWLLDAVIGGKRRLAWLSWACVHGRRCMKQEQAGVLVAGRAVRHVNDSLVHTVLNDVAKLLRMSLSIFC